MFPLFFEANSSSPNGAIIVSPSSVLKEPVYSVSAWFLSFTKLSKNLSKFYKSDLWLYTPSEVRTCHKSNHKNISQKIFCYKFWAKFQALLLCSPILANSWLWRSDEMQWIERKLRRKWLACLATVFGIVFCQFVPKIWILSKRLRTWAGWSRAKKRLWLIVLLLMRIVLDDSFGGLLSLASMSSRN